MSEWEPATDPEVAMRDALRTDDQESYFRILSGVDLLLPVSADALAGLAPLGWGTWSTGGRTHVLAFTSTAALQACLADYSGSARRVPYGELANTWPNLEWWLAVNPGLPIEGYLPAWFVAQLSRGDLRLPTRGPGREAAPGQSKIQDLQAAAMAANAAAAHDEAAGGPGGPTHDPALPEQLTSSTQMASSTYAQPAAYGRAAGVAQAPFAQPTGVAGSGYDQSAGEVPTAYGQRAGAYGQPASGPPAAYGRQAAPYGQPASGPPAAYGQPAGPAGPAGAAYGQPAGGAGFSQPTSPAESGSGAPGQAAGAVPAAYGQAAGAVPAAYGQLGSPHPAAYGQPAGYTQRPGTTPAAYPPPGDARPAGAYASPAAPAQPYGQPGPRPTSAPPGSAQPTSAPPRYGNAPGYPAQDSDAPGADATPEQIGPGGLPIRRPGGVLPSGLPARAPTSSAVSAVPSPYRTPAPPTGPGTGMPGFAQGARSGVGSRSGFDPENDPSGPAPDSSAPLPVRTPMAQTPPVPENFAPHNPDETPFEPRWSGPGSSRGPAEAAEMPRRFPAASPSAAESAGGFPQGPASPQAASAWPGGDQRAGAEQQQAPAPGFGGPLPRRQANPPTDHSAITSFPAFQTPADRPPSSAGPDPIDPSPMAPQASGRPGLVPPVIPGAVGSDRPARFPASKQLEVRDSTPVPPPMTSAAGRPEPAEDPFVPANDVEYDLHDAADAGNTDRFLSTLLLATVLVPVAHHSRPGSAPGESGFAFRTEEIEGERYLVVFTSKDRLADHFAEPTRTVSVRFYELIRNWPDPVLSFAVNPGTPVGAKYPGPQVIALANWATEAGLGAEPDGPIADEVAAAPVPPPAPANDDAQHATVMQKTVPPEQIDYYLERGYDRVAGFVHRATEVEHLRTPTELFAALGLTYDSTPHHPDAKEAYVLRWPAYRPSLYRIPYGGQNEQALRAMDGWVIERAPFRGNGFAPGESRDVVAEFKVDSVRLPHGAQLWRIEADGTECMIAIFDNDGPLWRRVGEQ